MKKTFKHLVLAAITFTSIKAAAQAQQSLLWEISGNGLEKPSYIFGTIHMICNEDYIMTPVIRKSLSNAGAFYAEINFADGSAMADMQASLVAQTPLSKRVDPKRYQELKTLLKETVNVDISTLENVSDAGIASLMTFKSFPCTEYKMYEVELLQSAIAQNKELGGLETVKEQLVLMEKSMDMEAIIKMLHELKKEGFESTRQMVRLYKSGNVDNLLDFMNKSSYMDETVSYEMLTKRNHEWIAKMPEIMKKQSTFFAVGAAHLGGNEGVLRLLNAEGYEVRPVNIN